MKLQQFVFYLVLAWVVSSVLVSVGKAMLDNCGKAYTIESVVSGNWFCPKK